MIAPEASIATPLATSDTGPALPIEGPIVQAAMRLLEAKQLVDTATWLIQNNPRLTTVFDDQVSGAIARLYEASAAYQSYSEIISCKGQA